MKKVFLILFAPLISYSQNLVIETPCDYIVVTNDTSFVEKIGKQPSSSYPCFDSRIGVSIMHWFSIEEKAYIRKRMKSIE